MKKNFAVITITIIMLLLGTTFINKTFAAGQNNENVGVNSNSDDDEIEDII